MIRIEQLTTTSAIPDERFNEIPDANLEQAHIALFMLDLAGGGIQQSLLRLAADFIAQGHRVDLVVCKAAGPHREHLPLGINLVALESLAVKPADRALGIASALAAHPPALRPVLLTPWFKRVPALARYLRRARPQVLLSAGNTLNCIALLARRRADKPTRLVVSEHNHLSAYVQDMPRQWRWRFLPALIAWTYPWADATVAVSNGVADDLASTTGLPRERIRTIYNPVVSAELLEQARAPLNHAWFSPDSPPVLLGVGSFDRRKDFPTLLHAFARIRAQRPVRLLILGEGRERSQLEALTRQLGIAGDVSLPGFVLNPYAYMARASVFVLSSAYEGLPTVLIEALACGCPVVSTNCPSGPAEILQGGQYGPLVEVGDDRALAQAILAILDNPPDRESLRQRGAEFSVERSTEQYLGLLLHDSADSVVAMP